MKNNTTKTHYLFVLLSFVIEQILTQEDSVSVHVSDRVLSVISERFIGVTLDTGLIQKNWLHLNFSSHKVIVLALGLSPSYLRIGGSAADFCTFQDTPSVKNDFNRNHYLSSSFQRKNFTNFNMSASTWDAIHGFVHTVGWDLIFDLSVLIRSDNRWNSSNALELLKYTKNKGYKMAGWELGNEPNSFHHLNSTLNVTAEQLARDYQQLSYLLQTIPSVKGEVLTGPSTTQLNKERTVRYFKEFLKDGGGKSITAANFHHYYVNGRIATVDDFVNPEILDSLAGEIENGKEAVSVYALGRQLWLGETASAYGGGAEGLSNAFVGAFMWLDKLGLAAKNNLSVVMRQSFYGGWYGLLDHETLDPTPDYWLTVLYKNLVGSKVLQTAVSDSSGEVRFYAHCKQTQLRPLLNGSVTLYGMNLKDTAVNVTFPQFGGSELNIFLLTAPDQNLKSRFVQLNGNILHMTADGLLPHFEPMKSFKNTVYMPPYSYTFIWISDSQIQHCYS